MHIRFENRLEDLLAFNQYHMGASVALRRAQRRPLALVALIWLGSAGFLALGERSLVPLIFGTCFTVVGVGLMYLSIRWRTRRLTRKLMAEGSNKSLYGWHELELTGDQLTKRSLYLTTIMDVRLIERIAETPHHAFIYYSAVNALVIPRRDVPVAEYHAFIEDLREALGAVRQPVEVTE